MMSYKTNTIRFLPGLYRNRWHCKRPAILPQSVIGRMDRLSLQGLYVLRPAAAKKQLSYILAKEGWFSLDEKGLSWAETMLSLLIIFMLFGTLMPTMQKMQQTLDDKQLRTTAFETLHEAAKTIKTYGISKGERTVNDVVFSWDYDSALCARYKNYRSSQEIICIE